MAREGPDHTSLSSSSPVSGSASGLPGPVGCAQELGGSSAAGTQGRKRPGPDEPPGSTREQQGPDG